MRTLKCLQLNCHKSKAVVANLRNELMDDMDVGLIQEPHTYENDVKGLSGFQVLHAGDGHHANRRGHHSGPVVAVFGSLLVLQQSQENQNWLKQPDH